MDSSAEPTSHNAVTQKFTTAEVCNHRTLVQRYLIEHEPEFAKLYELQRKGWSRESGDTFFEKRHKAADNADSTTKWIFFSIMREIGREMNHTTGVLSLRNDPTSTKQVLDLCSATGGYSAEILRLNPFAKIDAISLDVKDGGHTVLIPFGRNRDERVSYLFVDITMFATEFGVDLNDIPADHPDMKMKKFLRFRPYNHKQYDLVSCDGQVLRTHQRESYRENCEGTQLTNAQLILGLQRIRAGGTLVILLHRLDSWDSVMLVRSFCKFADVQLFKPTRAHTFVSSFYMVAKNIQPENEEAKVALEGFKGGWYRATFGGYENPDEVVKEENTAVVAAVLEDFGPRLVELGRGIWKIQADASEKAHFMQDSVGGEEGDSDANEAEGQGPSASSVG